MSNSERSKNWCFTINNWTEENYAQAWALETKYIIIGKEKGESGTPHLQGFVVFPFQKTFSAVKKLLPHGAHIEAARGTTEEASKYCEKDGDFQAKGELPKSQKRKGADEKERWELAKKAAIAGDIDSIPADIYYRYYAATKAIMKDHMKEPEVNPTLDGEWHYGPSGCGKSRGVREKYPGAYYKMCNKWWDGYQLQETVIIEDIDKVHSVLGHHLKIWGDHGGFIAETKGGATMIRPKRIIVTSNYSIQEIFNDEKTYLPLERRFKEISYYLCPI